MKALRVLGTVDTGHYEYDSALALLHIDDAARVELVPVHGGRRGERVRRRRRARRERRDQSVARAAPRLVDDAAERILRHLHLVGDRIGPGAAEREF